jgi:hypothetical protein
VTLFHVRGRGRRDGRREGAARVYAACGEFHGRSADIYAREVEEGGERECV